MISLAAKFEGTTERPSFIGRITKNRHLPRPLRTKHILLLDSPLGESETEGFEAVVSSIEPNEGCVILPAEMSYLDEGDIVRLDLNRGTIRALFRMSSPNNGLLVTERCNSKCVMCSQPPRNVQDGYLVEELLEVIRLMPPNTPTLGFTGGEITLLQDDFPRLLEACRSYLPRTWIDVLTNGRLLSYLKFAQKVAAVEHPNLILCIPLYADVDSIHDYVVQAKGAFDQTIRGIMNLGRVGVRVEIRVVLHRATIPRLPQLAEFIAMNLPFVSHVALMGLEITGFTRANLEAIWIDPYDYQAELTAAVEALDRARICTSIYNHPLCLLPPSIWPFARKSISDWKNTYLPECAGCTKQAQCGGFFASATRRHSEHIRPFA